MGRKEEIAKQQKIIDEKVVKIINIRAELEKRTEQLVKEKEEKMEVLKELQEREKEIEELTFGKTIICLSSNVSMYRTREEQDAALDHITTRMDNELKRLGVENKFVTITLPDTVTGVHVIR